MDFKNLRFSMGHCGYPWYDECMELYGKFRWIRTETSSLVTGEPSIYDNDPWMLEHTVQTDEGKKFETPHIFLDTTRGAHRLYRRDLLTKLVAYQPDGEDMFFGTDKHVDDYPVDIVRGWLEEEKKYLDEAGATQEFRQKMYAENLFKFLGTERKV